MTTAAAIQASEELCLDPRKQAREWLALGVRQERIGARLQEEYELDEAAARDVFEGMIEELQGDYAHACEHAEQRAADFYRSVKHDPAAPWGARLKAQMDLERLLQLVERCQQPGGRADRDVLEAFAFHEHFQVARGPTAAQRIRSHARLLQLLGIHRPSERRAAQPAPAPVSGAPRASLAGISRAALYAASLGDKPTDDELAEFARRQLVAEMEDEEQEYESAYEELVASGVPPEEALEQIESQREARDRQQFAALVTRAAAAAPASPGPQTSAPRPTPTAQPPPG